MLLVCGISFWFFLWISISSYCLSVLTSDLLYPLKSSGYPLDCFKSLIRSVPTVSGSDACSVSSDVFFLPSGMPCHYFQRAKHGVWDKRNAANRLVVIWWWGVGRGEVVCRPMIRSQSFHEPVILYGGLHNCFSVLGFFFSPLMG